MNEKIKVIGAGLAGSEAAWQLAKRGFEVELWEMRPKKSTPAHNTDKFGELVCSNSLKSNELTNACGLLKEEMRMLDSIIIEAADATALPAGAALAVDRIKFSQYITDKIKLCKNICIVNDEFCGEIDDNTVIATGPLTSDSLARSLKQLLGSDFLSFFDASAPIVDAESIDVSKCFKGSRYGNGGEDYINCPLSKEEYYSFVEALLSAETADVHGFEKNMVFEGCMPVEVMASRDVDTLRFGPMKNAGLIAQDGSKPYAIVQLRSENRENTMYNLVGFQTHLKFGEQKRVFSMIPALHDAQFLRYGVMHRNTFIDGPRVLDSCYSLKKNNKIYIAGQVSGVEGYVESAASGLAVGILCASRLLGYNINLPKETVIGALASYVSNPGVVNFEPMNANYGIIPKILEPMKKDERAGKYAERSLNKLAEFIKNSHWIFK